MKGIFVILFCFLTFLPNISSASVIISEILYNPPGSAESGHEWVEIYNNSSEDVDLSGWTLVDGQGEYFINSVILKSGEYLVLDTSTVATKFTLLQSGEHLYIKDSSGQLVDDKDYSGISTEDGESIIKQQAGMWVAGAPTPNTGPFVVTGDSTVEQSNTTTTIKVNKVTTYRTVEIEPPQDIHIRAIADTRGLLGSMVYIKPEVYDATGRIADVSCYTTFGDGTTSSKCDMSQVYRYTGDYTVKVLVTKGTLNDEAILHINIKEPAFRLSVSEDKKYIELYNDLNEPVELNGWYIKVNHKRFNIPNHTMMSASSSMKISGDSMRIDIARLGGKAQLYNIFNKVVYSSSDFKIETTQEEEVVKDEEPTQDEDPIIVANISANIPVSGAPSSEVKRSILGLVVEEVKMPTTKTSSLKSPPTNIPERKMQVASVGVLPASPMPWLFGLLGLLTLALLPLVLVSKPKPDRRQDLTGNRLDNEFTIKEII
ncbi:MAG: lamin tail domain-containing protein [Candidatus Pacebacteria bacterium]|nr:lamin tail domain-containing protein [Candidatus Paceibacterota bacterium]